MSKAEVSKAYDECYEAALKVAKAQKRVNAARAKLEEEREGLNAATREQGAAHERMRKAESASVGEEASKAKL